MVNIIYIRTSTQEQNPENQLKDCLVLNKWGEYEVIEDKQSAWKDDKEREGFERLKKLISERRVSHLVVWDLDRIYRNRKRLIAFFEYCKINNCLVHSVRQDWLESLNNVPEPFNEIMHNLMLQVMGWLAEDESNKKSQRVRIAVRKENGITKSYKGNKWGRRELPEKTKEAIVEAYKQNKSYSQICAEVFYWNRNNNKKYVSRGLVHKTIVEFKASNNRNKGVQNLVNL